MKSAEKVLEDNLWGVHKPILNSHWSFKEMLLKAMEEYRNQYKK